MVGHLLVIGGCIFVLMGAVHGLLAVVDVFRPTQFTPGDDSVRLAMKSTDVRFSRGRAVIWDAWLGFNISHGLGMFIFGAAAAWAGFNIEDLGVTRPALTVPVGIGLIYMVLSLRFWFWAPTVGFALATICFMVAWWNR